MTRLFSRSRGHALAIALTLLATGAVTVYARQPHADPPNPQMPLLTGQIASVDMERVYEASGGLEQLAEQANKAGLEVNQHLKEVKDAPMLDQAELQEYGALVFKHARTPEDETRIKALRAVSDQRQEELSNLQVKPDSTLTPADKTRMRQLQQQSRLLDQILPAWQDDVRSQQAARVEMFRRQQYAKLRAVVGKVAAERGVAHVFDTSSLVYSASDLTPLVVQRVAKNAPGRNARGKDANKDADTSGQDTPAGKGELNGKDTGAANGQ